MVSKQAFSEKSNYKYNSLSHNIYYVNYISITKPSYAGYVFGGHNLVTTS